MEPPEAPETPLTLNPGVRVFPFDGASPRPTVLCEVTEEGEVVGRYTVPAEVAELMRTFDGTRATDRVVRDWCAANPGAPPPERCNQLVREVLQPRGLLLRAGAPAGTGVPPRRPSPVYLTYRVRLLPWAAVRPLARALGWTFAPPVVVLLLAVVVAAHVVFYLGLGQHPSIAGFTGADAVRLGLLSSLGALVHELGHATASVRYGCRKIEIGWGLYWYMTVLYTDLSEAWRLPRRQRAVVDVSGIYFQGVYTVGLLGLYLVTGDPVAAYAFLFTDAALAMSLHPFLRMDGFWLVSDLFGISNLRAYTSRMLWNVVARLRGHPAPAELNLDRRAQVVLAVYVVGGAAFLGYIWFELLTGVALALLREHGNAAARVAADLVARPLPFGRLLSDLFSLFWKSLIIFGMGTFVWRSLRSLARALLRLARLARPRLRPAGAVPGEAV